MAAAAQVARVVVAGRLVASAMVRLSPEALVVGAAATEPVTAAAVAVVVAVHHHSALAMVGLGVVEITGLMVPLSARLAETVAMAAREL